MAGPPGLAIFVLVTPTHPFLYRQAASEDDAAEQLAQVGAFALGGGTDLIVAIAEEISLPDLVIDLRTIPGAVGISPTAGFESERRLGCPTSPTTRSCAINSACSPLRAPWLERRPSGTWAHSAATCVSALAAGTFGAESRV